MLQNSSSIQTVLSVSELHRFNTKVLADSRAISKSIFSMEQQLFARSCALSKSHNTHRYSSILKFHLHPNFLLSI